MLLVGPYGASDRPTPRVPSTGHAPDTDCESAT